MNQLANIPLAEEQVDYILLDTSISMADKWFNLVQATNILIEDVVKQGLNSTLIVHKFSSKNIDNTVQCEAAKWPGMLPNRNDVGGMTPLFAAIQLAGLRLRGMGKDKVNLLIVTDGEETCNDVSAEVAKRILDWCRAKGWQVTFMGCDYNNFHQAELLGANESNTIAVATANLEDAARAYAKKRVDSWRNGGDIAFNADEHQKFGGYLVAPEKVAE